jgi:hypothetical protein
MRPDRRPTHSSSETAEANIARAVEAVSLKARTAAMADRLANQGMKSGSILPFTSALVALSAAACAAIVEVGPPARVAIERRRCVV